MSVRNAVWKLGSEISGEWGHDCGRTTGGGGGGRDCLYLIIVVSFDGGGGGYACYAYFVL